MASTNGFLKAGLISTGTDRGQILVNKIFVNKPLATGTNQLTVTTPSGMRIQVLRLLDSVLAQPKTLFRVAKPRTEKWKITKSPLNPPPIWPSA